MQNTAPKGSAIYSSISRLILLEDLLITENQTTNEEGFIVILNYIATASLNVTINDCNFTENQTDSGFGGIYVKNEATNDDAYMKLEL